MGQVACACLSDRNSHACRSGRFKIASTFRMIYFPSETRYFPTFFCIPVRLLSCWVPCRGPLRPSSLAVAPLHPSQAPRLARVAQAQPGLSPHQTPSNIHNGRKNRQQRHRTSSPAAHLDSCASSSVCNRCGPHIKTFYFHPYSRYPPPRVAPPNPTPLAAHGSSHFIPPFEPPPRRRPPFQRASLAPTYRPTDRSEATPTSTPPASSRDAHHGRLRERVGQRLYQLLARLGTSPPSLPAPVGLDHLFLSQLLTMPLPAVHLIEGQRVFLRDRRGVPHGPLQPDGP